MKVQFVLGAGLSSRLISWYGNGYGGYSHVDAVLSDGSLLGARSDAIGGKPPGVQIRPVDYEKWEARDVVSVPATADQDAKWEVWLKQQVGCPYDTGAIWGFILGRQDHANGRWICSALQTGALYNVGKLPPIEKPPTSQITPNSLRLMLLAIGGKEA